MSVSEPLRSASDFAEAHPVGVTCNVGKSARQLLPGAGKDNLSGCFGAVQE